MATRGEPEGYVPEPLAAVEGVQELVRYTVQELSRIAAAFDRGLARKVEFLNVEPTRREEGMVVGADGTDWNPGAGKGVYAYYSGAWNRLG